MSNELAITQETTTFLDTLIKSGRLPGHVKSIEEAYTVAQMGKELGFQIMQSFHYIIPISGKLSLSAKAIGAILRRGKVTYQTIEDAIYLFRDGSTSEHPVKEDGTTKAIDRRTTIKFIRDGIEEIVTYTWSDAQKQGLTTKDNWTRMPREMLWSRCLSKGGNRVASDLLLGLYSTDELFDVFGTNKMKVKRDDDGTILEIIDDTQHPVANNDSVEEAVVIQPTETV